MNIIVLMTCHNRREATFSSLHSLFDANLPNDFSIQVILVDDGSTDGTVEAVSTHFPGVTVVHGDGTLFWNRGMHRAQELAIPQQPDFLLWLNDDTLLSKDALVLLLNTYEELLPSHGHTVVVGATADREGGYLTYGGAVSVSPLRRFTYRKVWSADQPVECDSMNGNVVLLPLQVVRTVGNLDPVFEHAMGDTDYALRARKAGYRVFVAPGYAGHCSNNERAGTYFDTALPFVVRWQKMLSRKGLPMRSWLHFTRKHGGLLWPMYFVWPYTRLLFSALPRLGSRATKREQA